MKKKISLRNVILVLVPVLAAAGAPAAFSLLPKDDQLLLEGSVEITSTTCFAQAGGRVESVLVQPGQRVEAGELPAVLDDSPVDDQIALLKQTQAIKEAQLQQLKAPLNLDSQQAARRAAQANVDLTRLQLDQLERSREDYLIRAAADGVVVSASLEAGGTVAAGQGVFKLSSGNRQYAVFYLPQDYLPQVAFGDELSLFLQGSQEEAGRGRVVYIDLQAVYPPEDYENNSNRNQRSVKIKAELTEGGPFAVGQSLFLRPAAVQE